MHENRLFIICQSIRIEHLGMWMLDWVSYLSQDLYYDKIWSYINFIWLFLNNYITFHFTLFALEESKKIIVQHLGFGKTGRFTGIS